MAQHPVAVGPLRVEPAIDVSGYVGAPSCAFALNELGTVVGTRRPYGLFRGFSWTSGGTVDLDWDTIALDVNDRGEMAGYGSVTGTGLRASFWTSSGARVNVAYGRAYALNNYSQVVGFHIPPTTIYHAFRWMPPGILADLESLTGAFPPWSYYAPFSEARFIRHDGVMAGWREWMAVIWQPSGELSTLGPGVANSINDLNVVAGATDLENGQPLIWDRLVPTIITTAVGEATDINTAGYVVGWMNVAGERRAFVWHAEHGFMDLGPGEAFDLDEIGNVAGCRGGTWGSSDARATVWRIEMTTAEYLVGFESLNRRLLADIGEKDSRAVFRQIDLAQKSVQHSHGNVARRHLEKALDHIAGLEQSGQLSAEWAQALLTIGRSISQTLGTRIGDEIWEPGNRLKD